MGDDEMLNEGIQRIQNILDKSEEEGKAYEWSKMVNTLEYLSKGRNDENDINVRNDEDDDVFIEGEVDKRTEKEKESGSKINTEKEDKGNKKETNKRTLKKEKKEDNRNISMRSMQQKYNQYIYTMRSMSKLRSP